MFKLSDVYAAAGQPFPPETPDPDIPAAHFDSRRIQPGMLFVALPGARVDGNDYIVDALRRGAAATLGSRVDPEHPSWRQVTAPDALAAFQQLARGLRSQSDAAFIGVTGSNGKTSTKQALAAALGGHGRTLATDRSENTDVGVPTTLARLRPDHRYAVIEMGAQIRGEIESYCRVAAPDAAVITSISGAHIGLFGSIENIVQAKSELLTALPADAPAVLPADSRWLPQLRASAPGPVLTFGRDLTADIVVNGQVTLDGTTVSLDTSHGPSQIHAAGIAGPIDLVFGAAAATVLALGLDLQPALDALHTFQPAPHRMTLRRTPAGATLLDDTYNANAASMLAALDTLAQLPVEGRRIAVLGDMLELGDESTRDHHRVGRTAAESDILIAIGQDAADLARGARESGMPEERLVLLSATLDDTDSLTAARESLETHLRDTLQPNDAVLLKASNGIGLGPIADALFES
ncbi:MAG: UDP-N-acetylmuramoyl-tripeptide--D-alanyl-D-alanine ligase [Chloroflexota bacterium]|nr:UDP-N-acetylmuramoyl-tripeptide--D-alanyl-D-alanine ligase [Chloroflexota bacterium]MDE2919781.1 UDP-N-acetylmuramoyl-tripeptide--D-alanyl-D-alanine ligase [Chloroflexota bacterium]